MASLTAISFLSVFLFLTLFQCSIAGHRTVPDKKTTVRSTLIEEDPEDSLVSCSTVSVRGSPAKPCPAGQLCVIADFGRPEVDVPDSGVCRDLSLTDLATCDLSFCAKQGTRAECVLPVMGDKVTTCGVWSNLPLPDNEELTTCDGFFCTEDCPNDAVSSFGVRFCNSCKLQVASCRQGFSFTGPIDPKTECFPKENGIAPFLFRFCCVDFNAECLQQGDRCSTGGGLFPSRVCRPDTVCVLSDFGMPALDGPNSGVCTKLKKPAPKCSVRRCASKGESGICTIDERTVTCKAWATRQDGGEKPNCNFSCYKFCKRRHGNKWRWLARCKHCLRVRESCRNNFKS